MVGRWLIITGPGRDCESIWKMPGFLRYDLLPVAASNSNALNHRRIYKAPREFCTYASVGGRLDPESDPIATYYATQFAINLPIACRECFLD